MKNVRSSGTVTRARTSSVCSEAEPAEPVLERSTIAPPSGPTRPEGHRRQPDPLDCVPGWMLLQTEPTRSVGDPRHTGTSEHPLVVPLSQNTGHDTWIARDRLFMSHGRPR